MKVLHTADTHLGYKQYHKPERKDDFKSAFSRVVTEAIEESVDVVVHGGDIFHRSRPGINTLSYFFEELKRLSDEGIKFCTIVGNHDSTRDRQWPELIEELDLGVYLDKDGYVIDDVCFYGLDHVSKRNRGELDYQFESHDANVNVLVAHGLFKPFQHGDWDLEEVVAKSTVSFDGFLLGDNHKPSQKVISGCPATYPGSTERTAADQRSERGYNQVRIADGEVSITHSSIETREFEYVDMELGAGEGTEQIVNEIENRSIVDGCVLVVTISGEGERVSSSIIEKCGVREGALVVRVNDRRDINTKKSSFDEVTFTEPEEIIDEKISELDLTQPVAKLEEMARDPEQHRKGKLKDTAEEVVSEMVENGLMVDEVVEDAENDGDGNEGDDKDTKQIDLFDGSDE